MSTVLDEFSWRGMLQDSTDGAAEHFAEAARTAYIGFDPTAASLHVGSLLPIMGLVHLQRAGHTPIALVGGGTGLIGDPSGKTQERQLLTREKAAENAEGIRRQLEHFLDFGAVSNSARMRDNLDWLGALPLVDFLRDIGKHFSVNQLMAKESVKRRLADEETGISFTEFSYALLQSYDFLELFRQEGCTVQLGGSDQWGNITSGIDLIRRVEGERAFGVVFPLVTNSAGTKFGKSEAGNVWLDPDLTSPYRFYQFWINTEDQDVVRYLKFFSLLPREEVEALEVSVRDEPHTRRAQEALARDVTRRVHGDAGLAGAERATQALFGGDVTGLSAMEIADIFSEVPSSKVGRDALSGAGRSLVEVLADCGVASSRGDARRAIEGGGVYVNGQRITEVDRTVGMDDAVDGRFVVLRKGKKNYHLVEVEG
ncbi:MAG: tyrosine--tRNA ligase [Gemmatimonadota bacterium]|nr:tyrosine--tRNA ligase [Gemmatimonadota bacterium]